MAFDARISYYTVGKTEFARVTCSAALCTCFDFLSANADKLFPDEILAYHAKVSLLRAALDYPMADGDTIFVHLLGSFILSKGNLKIPKVFKSSDFAKGNNFISCPKQMLDDASVIDLSDDEDEEKLLNAPPEIEARMPLDHPVLHRSDAMIIGGTDICPKCRTAFTNSDCFGGNCCNCVTI